MTSAKKRVRSSEIHQPSVLFLFRISTTSNHVMEKSGDEIADAVLKEFERWPKKRKPLTRSDGVKEWVPLSGIVAQGRSPEKTSADHKADIG